MTHVATVSSMEDKETSLTRSIIACLRSSTEPGLTTLPFASFLSSKTKGSARPVVVAPLVLVFPLGSDASPGEDCVADEKRWAAGRSVDDGSGGSGRSGIGGMVHRSEFVEEGVGRSVFTGGCEAQLGVISHESAKWANSPPNRHSA